jgi:hypothetical protein
MYNNVLISSSDLNDYLSNNSRLIANGNDDMLTYLNFIINDIKLLLNIQINIIDIINNKNTYLGTINLIKGYIDDCYMNCQFTNNKIYNNIINGKILEEFKAVFGFKLEFKEFIDIQTFTEFKIKTKKKTKEFYVLNDLDFKYNKIIIYPLN